MTRHNKFLDTAEQIANHLSKSAYWSESRCNWIGKSVEEISPMIVTTYNKALSPDVYDGKNQWIRPNFLNLYSHRENVEYFKTAEGAVNQALSKIHYFPSVSRYGFYSGILGIGGHSHDDGKNLNNNFFIEKASEILKELYYNFEDEHLMDVISGNASGIPVLLEIYKFFKDEKIFELVLNHREMS